MLTPAPAAAKNATQISHATAPTAAITRESTVGYYLRSVPLSSKAAHPARPLDVAATLLAAAAHQLRRTSSNVSRVAERPIATASNGDARS